MSDQQERSPADQFMEMNGHLLQSANAKFECLVQQVNAFWGQKLGTFNPQVLGATIKSLNEGAMLLFEGIRELQLYQIELKKFLGQVRDEPNIDEGNSHDDQNVQEKPESQPDLRQAVRPPSFL